MKGDYYRYLSEVNQGSDREGKPVIIITLYVHKVTACVSHFIYGQCVYVDGDVNCAIFITNAFHGN